MLKINKIILIFLLSCISIISANASDYGTIYNTEKYKEVKYTEKNINFGNIKVNYNIGFNNEISERSLFYPIILNFSKSNVSGILEIYKENFKSKYTEEIGQGKQLYKKIEFENTSKLNTYYYKNTGNGYEKYYFYLNINGKRQKLEINNNASIYNNSLYITKNKIKNSFSTNRNSDLFILNQFNKIYFRKNNITTKELKVFKNYIFSGGNLVLNKELFTKYFGENKEIIKIKYLEDCNFYGDCNKNYYEKSEYFYKYGFGKIYLENIGRYIPNNKNIFLSEDEAKKILIDEVIKSKSVPFNVILYFTIIYFITFLFINFIFAKKYKNNKFFLFYSIPTGALFFLIIIISISFYYKGFKDIENKIQINHHLNNKILSQVFIANFSPNGGDYKLKIDKQNYIDTNLNRNYHFRENFSKKEIKFENDKIKRNLLGVNSSSILYFNYFKIENKRDFINNTSETSSESQEKFKTKFKLLNYFNMDSSVTLKNNNKIEEIILRKKETEFMEKISFGGEKNKSLVIDVFYK